MRRDSAVRRRDRSGPAVKEFVAAMPGPHKDGGRLIDRVRKACRRLAAAGWRDLLTRHGLNIEAADLEAELSKPLDAIDRSILGFEDFAWEGTCGIEPGKPARSLLFHAFASPRVGKGLGLKNYPTAAEIEAVENYVYGAQPPSIEDLRMRAGGAHLAIVVFAFEYRPGCDTVHRKHADMSYARTGITRVGTSEAKYLPAARGYLPFVDNDAHQFRVLPCRYAAYIAALLPGEKDAHGPMRFIEADAKPDTASVQRDKDAGQVKQAPALVHPRNQPDASRHFWIPLHKLFDGPECVRGYNLSVGLSANHVNEKIRRTHLFFGANGHDAGWTEPAISDDPFIFRDGIAGFSPDTAVDGSWLLVPFPHRPLIKPAVYKGKPLAYLVPESTDGTRWQPYQSSLNLLLKPSAARGAPEYLHARHKVTRNGRQIDLNELPDVIELVRKGGYRARHYQDFTGDGWIDVECRQLALEIPRRLPAYSIVATPDFFPAVKQSALMQWTEQSVPSGLLNILWPENPGRPQALSDQRFAANLELAGAGFDPADDTMTAIVGPFGSGGGRLTQLDRRRDERATTLPDAAAGVFAPGWDVAFDRTLEADPNDNGQLTSGVSFLTTYGLGSPFVEDSKLCAALSAFWPAVAPDTARTFGPIPNYATATPLTDEVIGLGSGKPEPWDGIAGPKVDRKGKTVEYTALAYGDYVEAALHHRFNIGEIAQTSVEEYVARTLTMAGVYRALMATSRADKAKWCLLSFRRPAPSDPDLAQATGSTKRQLHPDFTYRFEMIEHKNLRAGTGKKFKKVFVSYDIIVLLYADPSVVLHQVAAGTWAVHELRR
jgi:hypothetical protein